MSGSQPAYRLRGVQRQAGDRVVLTDVDLVLPSERITVLAGPSGSGKTSLLRLLNRLDDPGDGIIDYRGRPITEYRITELRRRVGFVFQKPVLFSGTVADNLREAAEIIGMVESDRDESFRRALGLAELETSLVNRPGEELSVGQQQRVTLARALLSHPETLLLDEPTSALDARTSAALLGTIGHLVEEQGLTVILSTHRMEEIRDVAHHAVLIDEGRIERSGSAESVLGREAVIDAPTEGE